MVSLPLPPLHQARIWLSKLSMSQEEERWPRKTQVMMMTMKISSIIKATMKLMSRLNKKGLEYNPKTRRFSPKGDPSSRKMVCYNCGEKGHISPKCSKPKKHQEKSKNKGKAPFGKKKNFKSRGRAYIGEWLSSDDEDERS